MGPRFRINVKISPFGTINYEISSVEIPSKERKEKTPSYSEPLTTDVKSFEIHYDEGDTYTVPKTTAGV